MTSCRFSCARSMNRGELMQARAARVMEVTPRLSRTARSIRESRLSIRRLIDAPAGPPDGVTVVMTGSLRASPPLKHDYAPGRSVTSLSPNALAASQKELRMAMPNWTTFSCDVACWFKPAK
jgi:hypothetical protein